MSRQTIFSPCRKYRYTLWREFAHWGDDLFKPSTNELKRVQSGFVQFIGLNPSTANETQDDPTIRRCIQFTKDWGYGAMCMTNLFAFRATDPRVMKAEPAPIGADNTNQIMVIAKDAALIVAAWGRDGGHLGRGQQIIECLTGLGRKLHHLGLNDDGSPKHPLYLRSETKPTPFP